MRRTTRLLISHLLIALLWAVVNIGPRVGPR